MEGRHHPGRWKRICVTSVLFLLIVLKQCDATEELNNFNKTVPCQENEYLHTGFCCDKCPPGFKLKEKCSGEGQRSKCEKCSLGTYQDHTNHFKNCFSCREPCYSASKEIEIAPCTHEQDRVCGCQPGYYKNVVNEITMSCEPCRKCGDGERETRPCEGERNTVCDCKYNHYRVAKGICAQCTNCSSKCMELCPLNVITMNPTPGPAIPPPFIMGMCLIVVVGLVCNVCVYIGVKHWMKNKQTQYSQSSGSHDPEKQAEKKEKHSQEQVEREVESKLLDQPDPVLPDCIPREIKTHEFIYLVLDIVPVSRFKELVRRLNVSEQDIDRAERDHRAFVDAQYQMLMVWAESGTRGGKGILPCPLLEECLNTLNDMNLSSCAESLEEQCLKMPNLSHTQKTSLPYN